MAYLILCYRNPMEPTKTSAHIERIGTIWCDAKRNKVCGVWEEDVDMPGFSIDRFGGPICAYQRRSGTCKDTKKHHLSL